MSKLIKKLGNTLLSLMLFSMTTGSIQAAPLIMISQSSAISMSSFANANQSGINNKSKGGSGKSQSLAVKSSS